MPFPKDVFIIIFGTCKCILLGSKGVRKVADRTKIASQLTFMSIDHSGLATGSKESTDALWSIRGWQKKRERCDLTRLSSSSPDEEREKRLDEQRESKSWRANPQRQLTLAHGNSQTADGQLWSLRGTQLDTLNEGDS